MATHRAENSKHVLKVGLQGQARKTESETLSVVRSRAKEDTRKEHLMDMLSLYFTYCVTRL